MHGSFSACKNMQGSEPPKSRIRRLVRVHNYSSVGTVYNSSNDNTQRQNQNRHCVRFVMKNGKCSPAQSMRKTCSGIHNI